MIEKGYFFIEVGPTELLDLGSLTKEEWRNIDARAKAVMKSKQTDNEKIAFLAGFLNFLDERQAGATPFGDHH